MKKGKKVLSILTSLALIGSIFGGTLAAPETALAKTTATKFSFASMAKIKNTNCSSLNSVTTGIERAKSNIAVERISGNNRYETATNISKHFFVADYVVIATGENYPDALCAAPLAYQLNAPILLTESGTLNYSVKTEITRLGATKAVIVGGTGAVSTNVEESLKALGMAIIRIAGTDRYDTSVKVAGILGVNNGQVVMATGLNFPDALSIAGIASMMIAPILLTDVDTIPASTQCFLNANKARIKTSYVVGGTGVISNTVKDKLPGALRLSGANRYETNKVILQYFNSILCSAQVIIATGINFPDALACSAYAPYFGSPIILADTGSDSSARDYIGRNINTVGLVAVVGGQGAVPDSIMFDAANNYGRTFNNPAITLSDANLKDAVTAQLGMKPTDTQYKSDFNEIMSLNGNSKGIKNISGLENCANLKYLNLGETYNAKNSITNLAPISKLTNLTDLDLSGNGLTDANLSALSGLKNMDNLYLVDNNLTNVSALSSMEYLEMLDLKNNKISSIDSLKTLTSLFYLNLVRNSITKADQDELVKDLPNCTIVFK